MLGSYFNIEIECRMLLQNRVSFKVVYSVPFFEKSKPVKSLGIKFLNSKDIKQLKKQTLTLSKIPDRFLRSS